jgi:hypothetical protein
LAGLHAHEVANQKLGDRPYYAEFDFPISTETLGLKVPGGPDVSLADLVGKREWRGMVEGITQFTPFTTLIEWGQAAEGLVRGGHTNLPSVIDQVTPFWGQLINAAGLGQHGEKSGAAAFVQGAEESSPYRFYERLTKPAEDRAKSIYPRADTQEEIRIGLGAMAPKSYNEEIGQQRAAQMAGGRVSHVKYNLANLDKLGLQGETKTEMNSSLHVLDHRDEVFARIDKDTSPNTPERERKKTYALLDMLEETGWVTLDQANSLHAYFEANPSLSVEDLRKDRNYLWRKTIGPNITGSSTR